MGESFRTRVQADLDARGWRAVDLARAVVGDDGDPQAVETMQVNLSRWLGGVYRPSAQNLLLIARALDWGDSEILSAVEGLSQEAEPAR